MTSDSDFGEYKWQEVEAILLTCTMRVLDAVKSVFLVHDRAQLLVLFLDHRYFDWNIAIAGVLARLLGWNTGNYNDPVASCS